MKNTNDQLQDVKVEQPLIILEKEKTKGKVKEEIKLKRNTSYGKIRNARKISQNKNLYSSPHKLSKSPRRKTHESRIFISNLYISLKNLEIRLI